MVIGDDDTAKGNDDGDESEGSDDDLPLHLGKRKRTTGLNMEL